MASCDPKRFVHPFPKSTTEKRKHTTSEAASQTRRKTSEAPVVAARHLFTSSFQRVLWLGEQDEIGEGVFISDKERKACLEDDLHDYILRMQHRSPLCWFREADAIMCWKNAIASPIQVILETADISNASAEETCRRLVTVESVAVLIEHALIQLFRDSDTCGIAAKDRLLRTARKYLFDNLPNNSNISWSSLETQLDANQDGAYELLSHVRNADGVIYTSTNLRGVMDRRMYNFLTNRDNFYIPPLDWKAAESYTHEQAEVFTSVLEHLRKRGWSVLSGPGGAGKTHMIRHIASLCKKTQVISEGDALDCPSCGEERLVQRCAACGYERQNQGERDIQVCFLGPTNRAVAVLASAVKSQEPFLQATIGTVHSIARRRDIPPQDLLVIDESSMLASEHGDLLLKTNIFRKSAWLLVGDHLQLLPVGKGEFFRPLKVLSDLPSLKTNMRAKNVSLAGVINGIRNGSPVAALPHEQYFSSRQELLQGIKNANCDLVLAVRNDERIRYNAFCIQSTPCAHAGLRALDDYRKFSMEDVLTGRNIPRSFLPYAGMPVRFQTNIYKPTACRGDLGRIESAKQLARTWYIQVMVNNNIQRIESSFFCIPEHIRPAFATTLHDAQGAQSSKVGIILPPSARCPILTLETLYTAVSRAQDEVVLFTHGCRLGGILGEMNSFTRLRTTPLSVLLAIE